jgi:putative acetyltransferase
VVIRREQPSDEAVVAQLTVAAFAPSRVELRLLAELRAGPDWIPELSLVAVGGDGGLVGHVVCTRARLGAGSAVGLGPISVRPDRQRAGVGSALMHAVLGAADALGEPVVCLLGDPAYYGRFGFRPASELGIEAPDPEWGAFFQARPLAAWTPALAGRFVYAEPFLRAD